MSLFAVADLHLSFGVDKPMDVFGGWNNHVAKIKQNWLKHVKETDTVVVAGDLSWGMDLNQSKPDFEFIDSLPGRKILLKGNHDYYFSTKKKLDQFFFENGFKSLNFLHNNSFECGDVSICGTRGWVNMAEKNQFDEKILKREAGRLRMSIQSANKLPIVFLHYPPIFCRNRSEEILKVLNEFNIKQVYYGHLHGDVCKFAVCGFYEGVSYQLISSDYLNFNLFKIF